MTNEASLLHVSKHALVAAKLTRLRDATTAAGEFRKLVADLSVLLAAEATSSWTTKPIEVQTPLASCAGVILSHSVVLVPILRAGLGMLEGVQQLFGEAAVGHLGLYRDEETLRPVSYFARLPVNLRDARVLLLDPMLATGHSACEAVSILKAQGAVQIQLLCLVAAPVGIETLHAQHRDVPIVTAAVDRELNVRGYIVPGLGDAGDRCFGTG